jgi:hypothetical protein
MHEDAVMVQCDLCGDVVEEAAADAWRLLPDRRLVYSLVCGPCAAPISLAEARVRRDGGED